MIGFTSTSESTGAGPSFTDKRAESGREQYLWNVFFH
jgi:hypothetical protein